MKKLSVMAVALLMLAGTFSACSGSSGSDGNNVAAIVGALFIQVNGGASGNGATANAGSGGVIDLSSQAELMILNSGSATVPTVTWGTSPTLITVSTAWTDADNYGADGQPGVAGVDDDGMNGVDDCGEYQWAASDDNYYADGFGVAAGVVITLDTDNLTCTGGIVVQADGPIVMSGAIVSVVTNDAPVDVFLITDSAGDETIVVSGTIDVSGPDSATGPGIPGGMIILQNNLNLADSPLVVIGNIISNGGDSTFTNGNGATGGVIQFVGGDEADILIQANMLANGGDGDGTGVGGVGGVIVINNDLGNIDNTALGRVIFYNVNSLMSIGGDGELNGGPGGVIVTNSSESGTAIAVPMYVNGGMSLGTGVGMGGSGGVISMITNSDAVLPAALIADANLTLTGLISSNGGNALNSPSNGGDGGVVVTNVLDGNLYAAAITVNGGDGGDNGGSAGTVSLVDTFTGPDAGAYWLTANLIWAIGGDGADLGGDGGNLTIVNNNTDNNDSRVFIGSGGLLVLAGDGDDAVLNADGSIGVVTIVGNLQD